MEILEIIILILDVLMLSFYLVCSPFYMHDRKLPLYDQNRYIKYPAGFNTFVVLQWLILIGGLVWIFGWIGILGIIPIFIIASILATLFQKVVSLEANLAVAIFGIFFWSVILAMLINFFFSI